MGELTIDDNSLKEIQITAARRIHRKFVLALKGTQQILNLKVFKVQTHQKHIAEIVKESRDEGARPTKFVCGIIQGSNSEKTLTFMLPGNESVLKRMGIAESSYICTVNPYPAESLKKNIKASNAGFNKAAFKIIDSTDDPIFQSSENPLDQWDDDKLKSNVEVASYHVKKIWSDTREQAAQFVTSKQPDEVENQWNILEEEIRMYSEYKDKIAELLGAALDAEPEGKSNFIEAIKAVNVGDYRVADGKLDDVM